jgi:hypothetical protein
MSPSDDFGAEREQGDWLATPKSHSGPAVRIVVKRSPAQQEDRFGVWPKWVQFRRFFPAALLAVWLWIAFIVWIETEHKSFFEKISWTNWTEPYQYLVAAVYWPLIILGIVFVVRGVSAWWAARRRIQQLSAVTIRGVFGVQPRQSVNFRRWRYASLVFFFVAFCGLVWAGNTISKGPNSAGFWPSLIAGELLTAILFSGVFLVCTRTFSKVLAWPATPDPQLRERFMHDAGIPTVPLAPTARPPATRDPQLRERFTYDAGIPTAPPAPTASSPTPSGKSANTSTGSSTVVTETRSGPIKLPPWVIKLVNSKQFRWMVATICAAIINVLIARYI